jgi:hypothetical protein
VNGRFKFSPTCILKYLYAPSQNCTLWSTRNYPHPPTLDANYGKLTMEKKTFFVVFLYYLSFWILKIYNRSTNFGVASHYLLSLYHTSYQLARQIVMNFNTLISSFPILWDQTLFHYGDRRLRREALESLLTLCNRHSSIPISMADVKTKLKTYSRRLARNKVCLSLEYWYFSNLVVLSSAMFNPMSCSPVLNLPFLK